MNTLDSQLLVASSQGNLEEVLRLMGEGANPLSFDQDGRTAMHHAARKGKCEVIAALYESGADFDARDNMAATPLHYAAGAGHAAACITLARAGADLEAGLSQSADGQQLTTPLHIAAERGMPVTCAALVKEGAKLEALDPQQRTPLLMAAASKQQGSLKTLETLLAAGANPQAKDRHGRLPRDAAESSYEKIHALDAASNRLTMKMNQPKQAAPAVSQPKAIRF